MAELKRLFEVSPAFDERKNGYGIHGVEMRWVVVGEEGAVQFLLYTNWHLKHVRESFEKHGDIPFGLAQPLPADLGYHSRRPRYPAQKIQSENCEYLKGPCYYDGSGLQARVVFELLVAKGGEALWKFLENRYEILFLEVQGEVVQRSLPEGKCPKQLTNKKVRN